MLPLTPDSWFTQVLSGITGINEGDALKKQDKSLRSVFTTATVRPSRPSRPWRELSCVLMASDTYLWQPIHMYLYKYALHVLQLAGLSNVNRAAVRTVFMGSVNKVQTPTVSPSGRFLTYVSCHAQFTMDIEVPHLLKGHTSHFPLVVYMHASPLSGFCSAETLLIRQNWPSWHHNKSSASFFSLFSCLFVTPPVL